VLAEAAAGWRFKFGKVYLEPYARAGVPFFWGAGVAAGYKFDLKDSKGKQKKETNK
jgi:hypothetical protein